jgi:hypothetical protein
MAAVMTTPRMHARPQHRRPCDGPRAVPPARPARAVVHAPVAPPRRRAHRRAVYWRRRVVMAALALGTVVLAGQAGVALGGSPLAPSERRSPLVTYVVQPGDTMWDVAGRVAPSSDRRPTVDALLAARHHTPLIPGETITWQP